MKKFKDLKEKINNNNKFINDTNILIIRLCLLK